MIADADTWEGVRIERTQGPYAGCYLARQYAVRVEAHEAADIVESGSKMCPIGDWSLRVDKSGATSVIFNSELHTAIRKTGTGLDIEEIGIKAAAVIATEYDHLCRRTARHDWIGDIEPAFETKRSSIGKQGRIGKIY